MKLTQKASKQVECRYPVARGHLLVMPTKIVPNLSRCRRNPEATLFGTMFDAGKKLLFDTYGVKNDFVAGFSYPSEYHQVCLHLVVPPIHNFLLFRAATWYPYRMVQDNIRKYGIVGKRNGLDNSLLEKADIDPRVLLVDEKVRRKLLEDRSTDPSQIHSGVNKYANNSHGCRQFDKTVL